MGAYTRYLSVIATSATQFSVEITNSSPVSVTQKAISAAADLRYSPIMPAFLIPGNGPPPVPETINSIAFFFAITPYRALGQIKQNLSESEIPLAYFTEGLASILFVNLSIDRVETLSKILTKCPFEYWPVQGGIVDSCLIKIDRPNVDVIHQTDQLQIPISDNPEIRVYTEQISASLASLWASYGLYFPEERKTLLSLSKLANRLINEHSDQQLKFDSPLFSGGDFVAISSFATKLKAPTDPISHFVKSSLSTETLTNLSTYDGAQEDKHPFHVSLARDLNKLIEGELIYEEARFFGIILRKETAAKLSAKPISTRLVRLNRALLEDAFPFEISRNFALLRQKKSNAIISALVELSAALSYAVAQGTSGSIPILANRSPFPHHSLLGVGGAIRALTKYTRYLESAFVVRSAKKVIASQYSVLRQNIPTSVSMYASGSQFKFQKSEQIGKKFAPEHFDTGGDFHQDDHVPLITHFSLRHGFMESKFSVTAASEALTAETQPQWTLMTLSHEIMHSRVRTIFQALLGRAWQNGEYALISREQYEEFSSWINTRNQQQEVTVESGLCNVILNFCFAAERANNPVVNKDYVTGKKVSIEKLSEYYSRNKKYAIEILVHFHDYYFIYACQQKIYMMSLWASWIKVAAPYARPLQYLIRSLVTVACGTGLEPLAAFAHAKEVFLESIDALENEGIKSPLFQELRRLVNEEEEKTRAHFYPGYYLIDIVRLFFASRTICDKIDRIDKDPYSEGSALVNEYSANIFVHGDDKSVSPIRYSLATLFNTLRNNLQIDDPQWLTAWNYMVISN